MERDSHSPRWSLTTKASVMASRITTPSPCTATLAPSRNFLLRIQLELSVNSRSPTEATPPLTVTLRSPVSKGLFPFLSFTIFLAKSSLVHTSSLLGKSPSRTTISTLIDVGTPSPPPRMIVSGSPWASTILVPVKMGSDSVFANLSSRLFIRIDGP